jgi:1-acyl-sn-glycerol-3-phosphate acyltransferase
MLVQGLFWPIFFPILKFGRGLTISGYENILAAKKRKIELENTQGRPRGILIVSNHEGELDFARVIAGIYPFSKLSPIFFVGDSGKRYDDPAFGLRRYIYRLDSLLVFSGVFPVQRKTGNYELALKKHIEILANGNTLCIFPEGGYTNKKRIHGGAGFLVEFSDPIVIPVHISIKDDGTSQIHFSKAIILNELTLDLDKSNEDKYRHIAESILNIRE